MFPSLLYDRPSWGNEPAIEKQNYYEHENDTSYIVPNLNWSLSRDFDSGRQKRVTRDND